MSGTPVKSLTPSGTSRNLPTAMVGDCPLGDTAMGFEDWASYRQSVSSFLAKVGEDSQLEAKMKDIVEIADRVELYENPQHPYTKALLSAIPIPDPVLEATRDRIVLEGDVPSPSNPPEGCVFKTRCPSPTDDCQESTEQMHLIEVSPDHWVDACCVNCG